MDLILSKSKSLVDLVDLATNRINDPNKANIYELSLIKTTSENRKVDLFVHSRRFNNPIIDKLEMVLCGNSDSSAPKFDEMLYILNNFGGKSFHVEYETKRNTKAVQRIITNSLVQSVPTGKDARMDCLTFLDTKERISYDPNVLIVSFYAEGKRTNASLIANSNRQGGCSWELSLVEHRPRGPFARYRMSKINKYFNRYVEPKILYPTWRVEWA